MGLKPLSLPSQALISGNLRSIVLSPGPPGHSALEELRFDTRALEAQAGQVTLRIQNPSFVPHNVSIEGVGV